MKYLFKNLKAIQKPACKSIPGISLSLYTSLLTISASVGIGITFNPQRTLAAACAGVYSTRNGATGSGQGFIGYYNTLTNSYVDITTYTGGENINAMATQPSTGNLFFVNRATGKIVVYNVNTGSLTTLTGTLPGTTTNIVGATFVASGNLYVYYNNKTLVEVNPSTGSQVGSTITISGIPGNGNGNTNGDIAIGTDGTFYAIGDTGGTTTANITSQLYSITISGTTATATPVNGNNNISGINAANGIAIDPATGKFYISASTGTYELNTNTKVATQLTSTAGVNDLSACGSPAPDLPSITKAFSPSNVIGTPANSTLTLTLGNTNSVPIYLIQTLTDTLPSGLVVSTPNGLNGTCTSIAGNTVTATAGSSSISLNNGFKIPAGGCTVAVNVTASSAGTYVNNIPVGNLKTFAGDNPSAASSTLSVSVVITISGTVFSDADADVTINGSDAGTNAGSANLTIYAVDTAGKVLNKATVAANGTYSLTNIPVNSSVTLRLSNDSTVAIGATAPTASSIPSGWYYTGENKNGTVDGTIATLGNIALTTTTSNLTNENFGIRQAYTITADTAPTTCNPDYRTALNTGITAAGGQLAVGANDLNWTVECIAGPATGPGTPYAPPRPVGTMPAVVVGNLAPGAWINEPANAHWISYPFRLSVNSNGYHDDADLDGTRGEGNSGFSGPGTSDDVRLKFTSQLTLPSNANTISISLPVGVAIDNQFVSIKVNGVENLVPTPAANPTAADYGTTKNVNITNGWQAGVNTIEVVVDSGPDRVGFFLAVQATSTQVCTNPNVLLVKRITAINGDRTKNPNDNTALNIFVDDTTSTRQADDNNANWKSGYLLGAIDGGKGKPGDEIEYTIYFLNAGSISANTVRVCDRISANQNFKGSAYGTNKDIQLQLGTSTVLDLTSASDTGDRAQLISAVQSVPANCYLKAANDNGTLVIDVTGNTGIPNLTTMPGSTGQGSPNDSYGFLRFVTKVKP